MTDITWEPNLGWIFWVALVYVVAYSLFSTVNWFLDLGHAALIEEQKQQTPPNLPADSPWQADLTRKIELGFTDGWTHEKDREFRARRAALTFPRRERL